MRTRVCATGCLRGDVVLCTSSRLGVQEIMRTIVTAKGDDDGPRGSRAHDQKEPSAIFNVRQGPCSLTALRAGPPLLGWYTSGGPPRGRSLLKDRDVSTYAKIFPLDLHSRPIRIFGVCLSVCLSVCVSFAFTGKRYSCSSKLYPANERVLERT